MRAKPVDLPPPNWVLKPNVKQRSAVQEYIFASFSRTLEYKLWEEKNQHREHHEKHDLKIITLTSALDTVALPGWRTSTTICRLKNLVYQTSHTLYIRVFQRVLKARILTEARQSLKLIKPDNLYLQSSRLVMYFLVRMVTDPSTMVPSLQDHTV